MAYDYSANASGALRTVYSPVFLSSSARPYFHDSSQLGDVSRGQLITNLGSYATATYDRSGAESFGPFIGNWSPPNLRLPGAVAVVSLDRTGSSSALGSSLTNHKWVEGLSTHGWLFINATGTNDLGLPLLGSSFIKLTNPSAQPGVSGNYGITWPHGYTR